MADQKKWDDLYAANPVSAQEMFAAGNAPAQPAPEPEVIAPDQSANKATPQELDNLAANIQNQQAPMPEPTADVIPEGEFQPASYDPGADGQAAPEQPAVAAPEAQASSPAPAAQFTSQIDANELKQEDMNVDNDMKVGHIKPETMADLFAKKSTLGKIGTIFGLLVSGAGAGLTHQPNALLAMMQKEIDDDFASQKENVGNNQTLARLKMEKQRNLIGLEKLHQDGLINQVQLKAAKLDVENKSDSQHMMRMRRAALHTLVANANKFPIGSPQRQAAEMQLASLAQQVEGSNFELADQVAAKSAFNNVLFNQQGLSSGSSSEDEFQRHQQWLRVNGHADTAKENEEHYMPGLRGRSSVSLTADDRDKITSGLQFQNALSRFIDWTSTHSGSISPSEINEGKALSANLSNKYREATHGGVFKSGEQSFIGQSIDADPTKFFNNIRVVPKLKAVQNESRSDFLDLLKSKGFTGMAPESQQQQRQQSPMQFAKGQDGKMYQKVPGGWIPSSGTEAIVQGGGRRRTQ